MDIYEYNSPIVTMKQGTGKIINGNYKIIHTIHLEEYERAVTEIKTVIRYQEKEAGPLGLQIQHQLSKVENLLDQLHVRNPTKTKRSINWIGSAWKWVAGNPDATDWDHILSQTNKITDNNNKQYTINKYLMKTTNSILDEYNKIITEADTNNMAQTLFNKLGLLKDEITQIVMAGQLAKQGIVHSQLLNKGDIDNIISRTETLPYKNELQALQFAQPSMVIKDSLLLYIVSLPQTEDTLFNNVILRSTIKNNKRIYLNYTNLFISQTEKYGIKENCMNIGDITVCRRDQIEKLNPDHCVTNILNGGKAICEYQMERRPVVELISEGTLFLTNYHGDLIHDNTTQILNGTYIINFLNETITLNNVAYSNWQTISFQILPPVLQSNLTEKDIKLDLQYLHHLHLENIENIGNLSHKGFISIGLNFFILLAGFLIILAIQLSTKYRSNRGTLNIPTITNFPEININYP